MNFQELRQGSRLLFTLLLVSGLVACSKGVAEEGGRPIAEAYIPHIRAGLWDYHWRAGLREHWDTPGQTMRSRQYCDEGGPVIARGAGNCRNVIFKRTTAGDLVADMTCAADGSEARLRQVVRGDPSSAYTTDGEATRPNEYTIRFHAERRYLGPCPAGMVAHSFP